MSIQRLVTTAGTLLLAVQGMNCDRSPRAGPSPSPTTAAAEQIAPATAPATTAAASRPTVSLMNIAGHMRVFPSARLRLELDGDHLVALLFSDDPREALRDNYTGNSYYLRMELNVAGVEELPQAEWHFQAASSSEREDSPYGVFLTGRKTQLQPFDVRARFKRDSAGGTVVLISGQFQVIEANGPERGGPAQMLAVTAELPVQVDNRVAAAQ